MPDSLRDVIREAIERGARSFTLSPGSPTVRIQLEPEREYISQLRVFLAHATADKEWADRVAQKLSDIGFQVTYLPFSIRPGDMEGCVGAGNGRGCKPWPGMRLLSDRMGRLLMIYT